MPPPNWDRILTAAQKNNDALVNDLVVNENVSPSHANAVGQSALHIAALWGNVQALKALISHGASLSSANRITGATPIHCAVQSMKEPALNRVECVRILIEAGADPSVKDLYGRTPMDCVRNCSGNLCDGGAGDEEEEDEVAAAFRSVFDKGLSSRWEIFGFIDEGDVKGVMDYLKRQGDAEERDVNVVNADGETALIGVIDALASTNDNKRREKMLNIFKLLLDAEKIDPNSGGNDDTPPPLHKIATTLRDIHASSSSSPAIPTLRYAAILLLQHPRIAISPETTLLLHDASRRNNLFLIEFLINDVKIDVNARGRQGLSPLHFAARSGRVEAAQLLLQRGAALDQRDDRGMTPMESAVVNEKEGVVELLRGWGVEVK